MAWENLDAALSNSNRLYGLGYAAGLAAAMTAVSAMAPNGDDNFEGWKRQAIALIQDRYDSED